jgi:NADPH oxidase
VTNLNKVYFFWICPSVDTFEWFGEMLKNLENELSIRQDLVNLLEYKIYVTRGWTLRQAQQIAFNEKDLFDLCTGLRAKTNYGRPNFDLFFKELSNTLTSNGVKENVGVFFCGPKELSSQLHKYSNLYSNDTVRFIYNKENF